MDADCPCCSPPWKFRWGRPYPYTHMKLTTGGEIIWINNHGALLFSCNVDKADGEHVYITGTAGTGAHHVRKILASSGEIVWSQAEAASQFDCCVTGSNLITGGNGQSAGDKDIQYRNGSTGAVIWDDLINSGGVASQCLSVGADSSGNVYAMGNTPFIGRVKGFTSAGAAIFSTNATGSRLFGKMAVNDSGITLTSTRSTGPSATVWRYNLAGGVQWNYDTGSSTAGPSCAAYQSTGDVIVGCTRNPSSPFTLISFNNSGSVNWSVDSGQATIWAVCVDEDDNIYTAAERQTGEFSINKYTPTGGDVWGVHFDLGLPGTSSLSPRGISSHGGYVYVGGSLITF